ncbi:hypothetical protein B0H12DRAFT_1084301, partial [Mycena haematopus]
MLNPLGAISLFQPSSCMLWIYINISQGIRRSPRGKSLSRLALVFCSKIFRSHPPGSIGAKRAAGLAELPAPGIMPLTANTSLRFVLA